MNLRCIDCKRTAYTRIKAILTKHKKPRVQFHVECDRCGVYSHTLKRGELEEAVEQMLREEGLLKDEYEQCDDRIRAMLAEGHR